MAITLAANSIFDSRYMIRSLLGKGGMGTVYLAEDLQLSRLIALKLLTVITNKRTLDEDLERFNREGKALSSLAHSNIISVFRIGFWQGSSPYLAMEYFESESLSAYVNKNGPLTATSALNVVIQICAGLEAAHAQGIIHRDIKPQNVLVSSDLSTVKIVDFGLCSIQAESGEEQLKLTQTGNLLGTAGYMAPEFARGEPIGKAVDVYSLSCVLHELLTDSPLFDRTLDVPGLVYLHCNGKAPLLKDKCPGIDWPKSLENLLQSGLSKQAKERPSVQTFRLQLQDILNSESATGLNNRQQVLQDGGERRKRVGTVVLVASLIALIFCSLALWIKQSTRTKAEVSSWRTSKIASAYALLARSAVFDRSGNINAKIGCLKEILSLPDHPNEKEKIEALGSLSLFYRNREPKDALNYALMMKPLCRRLSGDSRTICFLRYLDNYSASLLELGKNNELVNACKEGIQVSTELPEISTIRSDFAARFYFRISDAYCNLGDVRSSIDVLNEGIKFFEDRLMYCTHLNSTINPLYLRRLRLLINDRKYSEFEKEIHREEIILHAASSRAWSQLMIAVISDLIGKGEWVLAKSLVEKLEATMSNPTFASQLETGKAELGESVRVKILDSNVENTSSDPESMESAQLRGELFYNKFLILCALHEKEEAKLAGKTCMEVLSHSHTTEAANTLYQLGRAAASHGVSGIAEQALSSSRMLYGEPKLQNLENRFYASEQLGLYYLSTRQFDKAKSLLLEAKEILSHGNNVSRAREALDADWTRYNAEVSKK